MLKIFINWIDVTEHYVQFTYKKTEQLKNRANKCGFTLNDYRVVTNQVVNIWDVTSSRSVSMVWTNTIEVFDIYAKTSKFVAWTKIYVNIWLPSERQYTIASVDSVTNTITLTTNITFEIPRDSLIGVMQFAGVTIRTPEIETSKSDDFQQNVDCVDYKNLLDRENVSEIFLNQYPREIFWRILYEFAANDTQLDVDIMEIPRTNWWTANVMAPDSTDRIFWNFSLRTSMTTGLWFWEQTFASIDISLFTHLRFWWKVLATQGAWMNSYKVKIGTDSSNYFQYDIPRIGVDFEDCWNYESVKIYEPEAIVWVPNLMAITYIRYEIDANANINDFLFEHVFVSTGGFTLTDTIRGSNKLLDIRIRQRKIADTFEQITRLNQEYWYLNYDRSISYYVKSSRDQAPIEVTETSKEWGSLSITPDTTNMRNRQLVIWWEAIEPVLYTQELVSDGVEKSFRLDYWFDDLRFYIQPWWVWPFIEYTVGIENLSDPVDYDWLANFSEKIIKAWQAPSLVLPAAWDIVRYTYFPYKPISYRYKDNTSVLAMKALTGWSGVYDGEAIIDRTIKSQEEAFLRAKAEVEEFKNPTIDCVFSTNKDWISAAQLVTITDSKRDIDDEFLIQRVTTKHVWDSFFEYNVTAASTLFGITEFLQMLLRRASNLFLDQDSIVFIVVNQDETIVFQDIATLTVHIEQFKAWLLHRKDRDFQRESGVQILAWIGNIKNSNRVLQYTWWQTGELSFDASTNHNNWKAMQITTDTAVWSLRTLQYILWNLKPSKNYTMEYWVEWLSLPTLWTLPELRLVIEELDTNKALLATHNLPAQLVVQDFKHYILPFTSNASSVYYRVSIIAENYIGVFQIADIKLYEVDTDVVVNPWVASFSQASA